MATAPSNSLAPHPPYFANAQVMTIDPASVAIGERIGMFWEFKAEALGKLIAKDGQRDPIKVRKNGPRAKQPWTLVAGLHRLEGCRAEGLSVAAIEIIDTDPQALLDIQASENLHRRALGPIERACFVRAIADVAEARMQVGHEGLSQQQIAARKRWADVRDSVKPTVIQKAERESEYARLNLSRAYGWRDEIAAAMGLSIPAIKRDLAIHRGLVAPFPDLWQALARHAFIGANASALLEIVAIIETEKRRAVIELLISFPALTVAEAKERVGAQDEKKASAAVGASKFMNNALANIERLSAAHQRQLIPGLLQKFKRSARVDLRDQLNELIAADPYDGGDDDDA